MQHYCWIKNFSAFAARGLYKGGQARLYCRNCLTSFQDTRKSTKEDKLRIHQSFDCSDRIETAVIMPSEKEGNHLMSFESHEKAMPMQFSM